MRSLDALLAIWSTFADAEAAASTYDVALGVVVVTSALEEYSSRVLLARQTWARGPEILFVAGAQGNASLGVESLPCGDDEGRGVCCKTLLGLKLALRRFPNAQWLVRAVDDTAVFPQHLVRELALFDARSFVYLGAPSLTLLCHMAKFAGQCAELHGGGGGGVVLSRPLVQRLLQFEELFLQECRHDDAFLGHFLRYVLDVHLLALPGISQEPRFASAERWDGGLPSCPWPLPGPVYSPLEDWGPLQPFAPLDATRLCLVHSDPAVWPLLSALPRLAAEAEISGRRVLVFAQGPRLALPHFRGSTGLGVCTYDPRDRLASFPAAAAAGF
ncbi:unnamed protein product [Effrenium voratum]|nr:unnamed protein product [Effrenium voratum]